MFGLGFKQKIYGIEKKLTHFQVAYEPNKTNSDNRLRWLRLDVYRSPPIQRQFCQADQP